MKHIKSLFIATLAATTVAGVASADLSQKSWADIEAQAKKEGQVTFSVWYLQPQWRTFVKDFEQTYGIKVKIPEGTIDGNINKLLAEKTLEKGKMDVIGVSADRVGTIIQSGAVVNLSNLPNFAKLNHHLQGVDLGEFAVGYWGNQTGFAYDPMRLKEDQLPQTWQQVEQFIKDNPKKFGYADPNGGSSGHAFIQRALVYINGDYDYQTTAVDQEQVKSWSKTWDWFTQNKANLTRTASNADSLTRLNDGELMIVSAWQDHLFSLQKQGAITNRLKFYIPELGMPGGGNVTVVAKNSPNPAASLLFVHWLTSLETQEKLKDHFGVRVLTADSDDKNTPFFSADWRKAELGAFTKEVVSK